MTRLPDDADVIVGSGPTGAAYARILSDRATGPDRNARGRPDRPASARTSRTSPTRSGALPPNWPPRAPARGRRR